MENYSSHCFSQVFMKAFGLDSFHILIVCCFMRDINNLLFQNHWTVCDIHSFDWSDPETQHYRPCREDHVLRVTLREQHPSALSRRVSRPRDARVQARGGPVCQTNLCVSLV